MSSVRTLSNYIDGELVAPRAGAYLEVTEPATGRPYARVPDSDALDIDRHFTQSAGSAALLR